MNDPENRSGVDDEDIPFDPIVEEARAWGMQALEESGGDLHALCERLMQSQLRHGDRLAWERLPEHLRPKKEERG